MKKPLSPKPGRRSVGGISQRLQLTEVGERDKSRTSFVSELGTAVEGRWYLGWSALGPNRFVNVFFLHCGFATESTEQGTISERPGVMEVSEDLRKLLHDPSLTTRRIVFAAVDSLLTATDLALTLGNFEFAVKDVLEPHVTFLPPPWGREFLLLDNLLDDGLNRRGFKGCLCHTRGT
jgi:hypothetical protein